ncbi:hydroxyisourate hydrolase [Chakrabartia godavariana]|nr:hydroxyisourate hydrolase [Chakrabartia godavariana]
MIRTLRTALASLALLSAAALAAPAAAATVSTHVLDLAQGIGGRGVPVVLEAKGAEGRWQEVARATTDENGRVRSFGDKVEAAPGLYRLTFNMSRYPGPAAAPFFPEITIVFRVGDAPHYHVPVVVSPYGYSTYRGN